MNPATRAAVAGARRSPRRLLLTGLAVLVATVFAAGAVILTATLRGEVTGTTIVLTSNIGGGEQERTVNLPEPPRLSNNAVNQLVATPEKLVAGQEISQEYFDPMSSGMSKLTFTYVEKTEVTLEEPLKHTHAAEVMAGVDIVATQ